MKEASESTLTEADMEKIGEMMDKKLKDFRRLITQEQPKYHCE